MNKIYLITIPERLWHWLNAGLFITLALTGILMHAGERLSGNSLPLLITVHNSAAVLFIINYAYWLLYNLASGRILHYLKIERDLPRRLLGQVRFYLLGIMVGAAHPFPATSDSKFNPLQRATYLGLMFFLVPAQILTGAVLLAFTLRVEWMQNLSALRTIALAHTALTYMLVSFLIGHLYLSTTGDKPLSLIKSMITGYHTSHSHEGE